MEPSSSYVDTTILSTPQPVSTSTVQRDKKRHRDLDEVPEKLSESSDSLGILSIASLETSQVSNTSDFAMLELQHQRMLANDVLERAMKVASIPSHFLRPSELSDTHTTSLAKSQNESTISESDLLPGDTSTPRASDAGMSMGRSLARMSLSLQQSHKSLEKFMADFHSSLNFQPASESKLLADEMSWKCSNDIPVERNDFSVRSSMMGDASVGSFFKMRSEDLSNLGDVSTSPEKFHKPLGLIDNSHHQQTMRISSDSLSVSAIQKILQDPNNTPTKAIEVMTKFKAKSPPKSETFVKENESFITESDSSRGLSFVDTPNGHFSFAGSSNSSQNKENIDYINLERIESPDFDKSIRSSRSTSSLSSLTDGKLPIESTKTELIWSCIKLGKSSPQHFIIRNKSSNRLRLQCEIAGVAFKLRERGETDSSCLIITFHPNETRELTVSFAPVMIGAAVDEIVFTSTDPNHKQTQRQVVRLFGYGGQGNVILRNLTQTPHNEFLLTLSTHSNMKETFILTNSGSLATFACFTFNPRWFCAFTTIEINPMRVVIPPKAQKSITVSYTPKKDDLKYLNSSIVEVGTIKMISSTEVNRGRIRRLCRKAFEKQLDVNSLCNLLKQRIDGESIPADVRSLFEPIGAMKDLTQFIDHREIKVSLQQDFDSTVLIHNVADETSMFRTISEDVSPIGLSEIAHSEQQDSCYVEPSTILLYPPKKIQDVVVITSRSSELLHYEAASSPAGLDMTPRYGELHPGHSEMIQITLNNASVDKTGFKVVIYVDNEVLDVNVKIFPSRGRF